MTEQAYQSKIIKLLEGFGWYVLKLEKTNKNGIPDVLALKDGEIPLFIEVKAKRGRASDLQLFRLKELTDAGFDAHLTFVGDNFVEKIIEKNGGSVAKQKNIVLDLQKPF